MVAGASVGGGGDFLAAREKKEVGGDAAVVLQGSPASFSELHKGPSLWENLDCEVISRGGSIFVENSRAKNRARWVTGWRPGRPAVHRETWQSLIGRK